MIYQTDDNLINSLILIFEMEGQERMINYLYSLPFTKEYKKKILKQFNNLI